VLILTNAIIIIKRIPEYTMLVLSIQLDYI